MRSGAERILAGLPSVTGATVAPPQPNREMLAVVADAQARAKELGDEYLSTEHLLLGIRARAACWPVVLEGAAKKLQEAFRKARGGRRVTTADPEGQYKALEKFGTDLTASAREGSSTPSSGGTRRSGASCRCSAGGPRTTPSSSASRIAPALSGLATIVRGRADR
ncbi:hypothetical protein H4N49_18510 [Streptomyces sp. DHE17-7]|nr:Clp protease N-terminal domain-containing protein [Streptomyces sp. DHE17-7]MBJ6620618.1 hypothetical protein [Streptomyces sp. DHE17-7]